MTPTFPQKTHHRFNGYSKVFLFLLVLLGLSFPGKAQNQILNLSGKWQLIPDESAHITYYDGISLHIYHQNKALQIAMKWEAYYPKLDSLSFKTDGKTYTNKVIDRVWPFQIFTGVAMIPGSEKKVTGTWLTKGKKLEVNVTYPILISQGKTNIHSQRVFELSDDGQRLTLSISRPTSDSPHVYIFRRGIPSFAYYMKLKKGWLIKGKLQDNAFLISLQGIVNRDSSKLYFVYPKDYDFHFTPKVFDFYKNHLGYRFKKISNLKTALKIFRPQIKGYIIWDKKARPSLNVAFTLAGLKNAVIVSEDMIPLMKEFGLKEVADLRGKFRGKTDAEIYRWAFKKYWQQCNHNAIVWMGGTSGSRMKPGIADYGIAEKCFFTDLSTDPADTVEYALSNKIMGKMKPLSLLLGWHSYAKDIERQYTTLASHYGLRIVGLNTMPDLSFTSRTPRLSGFEFKNNHNLVPGKKYIPKKKVYITCVQTDGLGLGTWNSKHRGEIPYAWEVTMNWEFLAPVMLEYFYTHATKNDFFFGGLSGPGYMYPKAIPKKLLPGLLGKADSLMKLLDLNVFETMDYSEGSTLVGNTDLPKYLVDAYFKYMPDAIGFLNGYAPSYTFAHDGHRPFISYDYYLSQHQPLEDAVRDLKELINFNKKRPYFLVFHIREFNRIERVKKILDQLGPNVEVVPLDVFLKLAGNKPTYTTRYLRQK